MSGTALAALVHQHGGQNFKVMIIRKIIRRPLWGYAAQWAFFEGGQAGFEARARNARHACLALRARARKARVVRTALGRTRNLTPRVLMTDFSNWKKYSFPAGSEMFAGETTI